jgi:hypothetical protein
MSEVGALFLLSVIAVVAFGVTRVSPHLGYSRGTVVAVASLAVVGAIALLLLSLAHSPMMEASGIFN